MDTGQSIHPLFQIALDAQDRKFVYQGFIHHLGPRPLLSPTAQARVALRCAGLAVPLIPDRAGRELATTRLKALSDGLGQRGYQPPTRMAIQNLDRPRTPSGVVDIAHAAVVHACERSRNTWRTARAAVGRTASLLLERKADPQPAPFLDRLDEWILRGELETVAGRRHGALLARVAAILYRSGDYPARPHIWLLRLESGELALLQRHASRLVLTEGRDDDVLANVPDAHFDYAVAAARPPR